MQAADELQGRHRFGDFTLDASRGVLLRGKSAVKLRPQSFDVLRYLVENHGRLVSRDELFSTIWKETVVSDGALTQCLIDIRKAIGDQARDMIRTVPRRGYIFDAPVEKMADDSDGDTPVVASTEQIRSRKKSNAALVLIVLVGVAFWVWNQWPAGNQGTTDSQTAMPRSIAVLPFVDMSEAGDQAYFSDGLSEEILNLLAQITELRVMARTSSFSFRDQNVDIVTIAKQLNVGWVLEGSVRQSGEQLRVTAQLVNATNGIHVWSQTYDRDVSDMFAIQTEIAQAVANELEVKMLGAELAGIRTSPQAYQLYLQAQFFHNRRADGDIDAAQRYYEEAVEYDPDFARAWAGLAGIYLLRAWTADTDQAMRAWRDKSLRAVIRALAADPDLAEAHARAFQVQGFSDQVREEHLRRALELDPNSPLVLSIAAGEAFYDFDFDRAVELQQRAADLDPVSANIIGNLAGFLYRAERYEEAEREARRAIELRRSKQPDVILADILLAQGNFEQALQIYVDLPTGAMRNQRLAMAYHATGQEELSAQALDELLAVSDNPVNASLAAEVHGFMGNYDEAFRWLNLAKENAVGLQQLLQICEATGSPFLKPLRSGTRWEEWVAWESGGHADNTKIAGD